MWLTEVNVVFLFVVCLNPSFGSRGCMNDTLESVNDLERLGLEGLDILSLLVAG